MFKSALRKLALSVSRAQAFWLTLLLFLAVLVSSVCLLWFLNQAINNERLAIRQRLADACQGQLALARERLALFWKQTSVDLETDAGASSPPSFFSNAVSGGTADAVIVFGTNRVPLYPASLTDLSATERPVLFPHAAAVEPNDPIRASQLYAIAASTNDPQIAAMALQARARCLLRAGDTDSALNVLTNELADQRFLLTADFQGRRIQPNAQLMAIELLTEIDPVQARQRAAHLRAGLMDYGNGIPSAQRRFLMRRLHEIDRSCVFPTLAAEDLADRFLSSTFEIPGDSMVHPTSLAGVWQFTSSSRRVVCLYHTSTLLSKLGHATALAEISHPARIEFIEPGHEREGAFVTLPAGPPLDGWSLAIALPDQRSLELVSNQRIRVYLWTGALSLAAAGLLAFVSAGLMRRQLALTRLRNDLVANVTHELKTPLASMRLLTETLLNSPAPDPQTTREYLELIERENLRLSRLIGNFLTFSRIERNKYSFDFKPTPPAMVLDAAAAAVRERFQSNDWRFQVTCAPDLPDIMADADALATALINLLDNAWKYSGDRKEIQIEGGIENGSVFFAVSDNGIGLSPRETRKIFKRFYQADPRRGSSAGGVGIGLNIVRFIVQAHHGRIDVVSRPGQGSTFTIRIPAAETPAHVHSHELETHPHH